MELLSASGQVLILAVPADAYGPAIPRAARGSQRIWHDRSPCRVPAGGRWRVVIEAVHYQPQRILYVYGPDDVEYVISGRPGHGSGGMLVVMAGLAGTGRITGRLAAGYAAAAGTVLRVAGRRGARPHNAGHRAAASRGCRARGRRRAGRGRGAPAGDATSWRAPGEQAGAAGRSV